MLLFLAIISGLILTVLVMILMPLLRPQTAAKTDANLERRAIFRQQFEELEQDKLNSTLDSTQYEQAKSELQRRMLDEVGVVASPVIKSNPDRRLAIILLLAIPIAAVLIYLKIGSLSSVVPSSSFESQSLSQQTVDENALARNIEPLLQSLRNKLDKNPQDGESWALLGRSYVELKRFDEAVKAYKNAEKLLPNDPQLLSDYADALAVNGHSLEGLPEKLAIRALKLDPGHPKALMLAGSAAFDRKDYKQAIDLWERLKQVLPADSEIQPELTASIAESRKLSNIKVSEPLVKKLPPQKNASASGISGTVRLAPSLASKLDANATLFVFARNAQGSPMPLAIVRDVARNLPYNYHLDDSSALVASHKLSQAGEVVIVARVSKTGDAKLQAGDLQGISSVVKANAGVVNLEIDQVAP